MEKRPLSKERRQDMEWKLKIEHFTREEIEELLAAEACWRESVKNAKFFWQCPFCDGFQRISLTSLTDSPLPILTDGPVVMKQEDIQHKPNCCYVAAQE